ncbi:hypothetical protein ACFJGW_11430 [Burkholderiaceae bacterium UC74_6]
MTPPLLPARRARWPLLLVLLFFHGLLFVGLSRQRAEPLQEVRSLVLRIVPPEPQRPMRPNLQVGFFPNKRLTYVPMPEVQVTAPPPTTGAVAVAAAPAASAASAPPARLNLALPLQMQAAKPTAKDLTANDLHAGQPNKKSIEYRVADAAGTLPVETLTTTDGLNSTMVRQGTKCTKIVANRLSTIDPFDSRAKLPPTSGDCFKK